MPWLVLFGGPAGAGKSTLAEAWCRGRTEAVHIELDTVRSFIVSGFADPQESRSVQSRQYSLSVAACCSLARTFITAGYDVALYDVMEPDAFERDWRPALIGLAFRLVIVRPDLDETLHRSRARTKRVKEEHTRAQHEATGHWPAELQIDTTRLTIEEALVMARKRGILP